MNLLFDYLFPKFMFSIVEGEGGGSSSSTTADEESEESDTEEEENEEPAGGGGGDSEEETVTIKGKQYKASDLIGADGVPRNQNKIIEMERKVRELSEKVDIAKGMPPQAAPQVSQQQVLDNAIKAVREKYPDADENTIKMVVEVASGFASTIQMARAPVDAEIFVDKAKSTVKEELDRKIVSKYEDEIDEALSAMPIHWKTTPQNAKLAVKNAIDVVKGRHVDDIIADAQKAVQSRQGIRPRDTSVASGSGGAREPKGSNSQGAGLTDEQEKDRQLLGNVSQSEYKGLLKKAQERDKAAGRPVRTRLTK